MTGRPVAMHAMRGSRRIPTAFRPAAPSTCCSCFSARRDPRRLPLRAALPQAGRRPPEAAPQGHPRLSARRPAARLPPRPRGFAIDADGRPKRIDKAFSWEAPLAAHGLLHTVIANAAAGDPYPIEVLFLYMANMAWNSSMNTAETMAMLTATDASGEYRIPNIIVADAYSSEMVAFADLVLPDTTYLERHDCSQPARPADLRARRRRRRHPLAGGGPRPRRAPVPVGAARPRRAPQLPGMAEPDGTPTYADYADYITRHQRRPGVGPLAGWRGADGAPAAAAPPTRTSSPATSPTAASGRRTSRAEAAYFKPWNAAYQDWAVAMGFFDMPQPYLFQLYAEPLGRFQAAALGKGDRQPPEHLRDRLARAMAPLPVWYPPLSDAGLDADAFPLHAVTQRPAAMYHSWGGQNAWLRQIHGENALYVPGPVWEALGFQPGDWATSSRRTPASPCRSPAWTRRTRIPSGPGTPSPSAPAPGRSPPTPGSHPRFLLNHLIPDRLPGPRPASPTPTRSPARPPGTTSASASNASPPAPSGPAPPGPSLACRGRPRLRRLPERLT